MRLGELQLGIWPTCRANCLSPILQIPHVILCKTRTLTMTCPVLRKVAPDLHAGIFSSHTWPPLPLGECWGTCSPTHASIFSASLPLQDLCHPLGNAFPCPQLNLILQGFARLTSLLQEVFWSPAAVRGVPTASGSTSCRDLRDLRALQFASL